MTERSANPSEKTRKSLSTLSICPKSLKNKGKRWTNTGQTRTRPCGAYVGNVCVFGYGGHGGHGGHDRRSNRKTKHPDTRIMSPLVTAKKPEKNAHSENRAAAGAAFYARNSHVAHT